MYSSPVKFVINYYTFLLSNRKVSLVKKNYNPGNILADNNNDNESDM